MNTANLQVLAIEFAPTQYLEEVGGDRRLFARNAALANPDEVKPMLSTDTFDRALELLELGYTFPSITEETGITNEDAEAVHVAWFNGTTEQVSSELQLAGVLELAAARLRSGQGWDEAPPVTYFAKSCMSTPRTPNSVNKFTLWQNYLPRDGAFPCRCGPD